MIRGRLTVFHFALALVLPALISSLDDDDGMHDKIPSYKELWQLLSLLVEILTRLLEFGEKLYICAHCTKDDGIKRPLFNRVRFGIQIIVHIQTLIVLINK